MNKRDWVEFSPLRNRRGASTVEYVIILVGILALALILSSFLANDGRSMIKDKIIAIINGDISGSGEKTGDGNHSQKMSDEIKAPPKAPPKAPKREQAKKVADVRTTDEQLMQMSDLAYEDISGLSNEDFNDVFGFDDQGRPNAQILDRRDLPNGFQAIAVKNKVTGEIVITYRGSDTDNRGIDWWGQDATIWTQTPGAQENEARKFVEAVKKNPEAKNSSIVLTGHSLGGFHAQLAAKETGLPAVTFNAPGLKPNPAGSLGGVRTIRKGIRGLFNSRMNLKDDFRNAWGSNDDQVVNYVNEGDAIGNFGIHYGKTVVTGNGKEPKERNDYTSPISSGEYGALYRAGKGMGKGGFGQIGEEHSLESFDGQYDSNGNIRR